MSQYKYVILGGGLAAGYAAKEFAALNVPIGELCIVSAEKTLPYERPSLSKEFLAGAKEVEDILINDPDFYEQEGIAVKLDTKVTDVDLMEKELYTAGETIAFEKLMIATGASPLLLDLPGSDLKNVFYLRHLDDAQSIHQAAEKASKAVVLGGSFIGMETTAVLQDLGVSTTMVFPEQNVWQAFFTPVMSSYFETYYRERGVTILANARAVAFKGIGKITGVVLDSGCQIAADLVVAGIGVAPNSELFQDSKLKLVDSFISVNRFLETNLQDVFAAGDVTRYRDVIYDRPLHLEHWDNAAEQGRHAARAMLGEYQPYRHVPYFFSDMFDLSYEFWGDVCGARDIVYRGDVASGSFSVWWLADDGRLLGAFIMDRPEEERQQAPRWIRSGKKLDAESLEDEAIVWQT